MSEQSPDEYIDRLERRFRLRERILAILAQFVVSSAYVPDRAVAEAVFAKNRQPDTLPHD